MTLSGKYVFVLFGNSIEIFDLDHRHGPIRHYIPSRQSIILNKFGRQVDLIQDGNFVLGTEVPFDVSHGNSPQQLGFIARTPSLDVLSATIARHADGTFYVVGRPAKHCISLSDGRDTSLLKTTVGQSERYSLYLCGGYKHDPETFASLGPLKFMIGAVHSFPVPPQDWFSFTGATVDPPVEVQSAGLPLLQFLSAMDFDDAAGILAAGTSRGEICLLSFSPSLYPCPDHSKTLSPVHDGEFPLHTVCGKIFDVSCD